MVAANTDIRSDLHRIAESIAARSDATAERDDLAADGPVGTFRDALLARYYEGYIEGLHDMAEAVVGYLNARSPSPEGGSPNPRVPPDARALSRTPRVPLRGYGGVAEWLRQAPAKRWTWVQFPPPPLLPNWFSAGSAKPMDTDVSIPAAPRFERTVDSG